MQAVAPENRVNHVYQTHSIQLFPNGTPCNPFTIVTRALENLIPKLIYPINSAKRLQDFKSQIM